MYRLGIGATDVFMSSRVVNKLFIVPKIRYKVLRELNEYPLLTQICDHYSIVCLDTVLENIEDIPNYVTVQASDDEFAKDDWEGFLDSYEGHIFTTTVVTQGESGELEDFRTFEVEIEVIGAEVVDYDVIELVSTLSYELDRFIDKNDHVVFSVLGDLDKFVENRGGRNLIRMVYDANMYERVTFGHMENNYGFTRYSGMVVHVTDEDINCFETLVNEFLVTCQDREYYKDRDIFRLFEMLFEMMRRDKISCVVEYSDI